jgi:hypothetical protein
MSAFGEITFVPVPTYAQQKANVYEKSTAASASAAFLKSKKPEQGSRDKLGCVVVCSREGLTITSGMCFSCKKQYGFLFCILSLSWLLITTAPAPESRPAYTTLVHAYKSRCRKFDPSPKSSGSIQKKIPLHSC